MTTTDKLVDYLLSANTAAPSPGWYRYNKVGARWNEIQYGAWLDPAKWGEPKEQHGYCLEIAAPAPAVGDESKRIAELEASELKLIDERDHAHDIIDKLCDAVLGIERQEWSSAYFFEDAVEDVEDEIERLKKQAPAVGGDVVEPDGYAYRYPDGIRHTNGRDVNGNKPIEAIPYYYGKPPATQGDARDTARYRWLRYNAMFGSRHDPAVLKEGPTDCCEFMFGDELDAAIDAAIAAQAGGEG